MKYLFWLLLLFNLKSYSQEQIDSLKKYSFFTLGFTQNASFVGSGCFVRYNGSIYFLTAKHVFSGCIDKNTKDPQSPEKAIILLHSINAGAIEINIKMIKDTTRCLDSRTDPDFILVKLDPKWYNNNEIFSIEKFIKPVYKEFGQTQIFGYPGVGFGARVNMLTKPSSINLKAKTYEIYPRTINTDSTDKTIDSLNYTFKVPKTISHGDSLSGFSGSPVFLQEEKTNQWRIVGLLSSGNDNSNDVNYINVVKFELIYQRLKAMD